MILICTSLTREDLDKIEAEMKKVIKENPAIERFATSERRSYRIDEGEGMSLIR